MVLSIDFLYWALEMTFCNVGSSYHTAFRSKKGWVVEDSLWPFAYLVVFYISKMDVL